MLGASGAFDASEVCPKLNLGVRAGADSCTLDASWVWPKLNDGVLELAVVCKLENGLLAGA